ncbi:MAG: DUF29 domain-containing protein [Gomphosphaeria aponina SAG 52.96 = DSM 107014]|uniref:DUF29 domain-containing protein n=1 Tax=Gomphosphaeria aponina SAG 52.96 = DSM 107014 TaxID=1521640 RepID=A0A941GP72_9CHRO|nr:DUF29 domain-containing protein [Gomphosphaeria aponina SAG 52.96 = DSM 107014]
MKNQLPNKSLYEEDFYLWVKTTAKQLRERNINQLDWQHLIEEIEALGNEQRHKVESYTKQLLIHLLLYKYWEQERANCGKGWQNEIANFRDELELLLDSKTLYNYWQQKFDKIYPKARKRVLLKTELPSEIIPLTSPFTLEEVLNEDYLPE